MTHPPPIPNPQSAVRNSRFRIAGLLACFLAALLLAACVVGPVIPVTPTPAVVGALPESYATFTPTPGETITLTPTAVPTETPAPVAEEEIEPLTETPTVTETSTSPATATPTPIPTATATPSPTLTPTHTPTPTPRPVPTATPTLVQAPAEPGSAEAAAVGDNTEALAGCRPFIDCVPTPAPMSVTLEQTENFLLLGSDLRAGEGRWHTDTLVLVAIDWQNSRVGVISFPRDYWLFLPWHPRSSAGLYDRINQADYFGETYKYPDGGLGLLRETFRYNFGIRLDHSARLHRQGFVDIVDALGGVDVELDCELWEFTPFADGTGIRDVLHLPVGWSHLDGETALKFVTYRYSTTDYDRSRRQQVLLLAMRNQFVRFGTLLKVPELWAAFRNYFRTDLTLLDVTRLAFKVGEVNLADVRASVIGSTETERVDLPSGAAVVSSKGDAVFQAIENLFDAPPIMAQAERTQGCPAPREWTKYYLTPTPTPEPEE